MFRKYNIFINKSLKIQPHLNSLPLLSLLILVKTCYEPGTYFFIYVHTGYKNVHARNDYPFSSHLANNYYFLQNLAILIGNNGTKEYGLNPVILMLH